MDATPVFRANKRRRFGREKANNSSTDLAVDTHPSAESDSNVTDKEGEVNVSKILRLRKQNRQRSSGVQFLQQRRLDDADGIQSHMALTKIDEGEDNLKAISSRFIGSTGQVVDVDKHMMAYVDSEIAKRQSVAAQEAQRESTDLGGNIESEARGLIPRQSKALSEYQLPTQLSEFDLGPDAQQKNQVRTEEAIARAQSGLPPPTEEPKPRRPRKPRLGRDGKPFRPRPRKRRNSEDVARDALVEQMLHEHRTDVYEGDQAVDSEAHLGGGDEDADEKLAEQFKQQFMDAMAERQQKHQAKAATATKAKGAGPEQSGPKLGGSRSARAKMAMLQQQQGQQQKSGPSKK